MSRTNSACRCASDTPARATTTRRSAAGSRSASATRDPPVDPPLALGALVVERRAEPQDDLVTRLAEAEVDGERLDDAPLSRLEGRIALTDLLERTATIALASDEPWPPREAFHVHGPTRLPIRVIPAARVTPAAR